MIEIVVLAAGASTRFGSDKLVADVGEGKALLRVMLDVVLAQVDASRVMVVVGPDDAERAAIAHHTSVRVVRAEHAARGLRWSIHAGLDAVDARAEGAIVVLADDPSAASALARVLEAAGSSPERVVVVDRGRGAPHPVYLPRATWPAAPTHDDDTGLRELVAAHAVRITASDAPSHDIDTVDDVGQPRS